MINIAVCDDEAGMNKKLQQKTLSLMKNELNFNCHIMSFHDPESLLDALKKSHIDIIEMDIELNSKINGIDAAQEINRISPKTKIIFVTAYQKYYLDVYDAKHVFFVEKGKLEKLLLKSLKEALKQNGEEEKNSCIEIRYKGEVYVVNKQSVMYIEKRLRLAEFNIINFQLVQAYLSSNEIMNLLKNDGFVQIHRSFIVNMRHVVKMCGNNIMMTNGKLLPVGKIYMKNFEELYLHSHQTRN